MRENRTTYAAKMRAAGFAEITITRAIDLYFGPRPKRTKKRTKKRKRKAT